MVCLSKVGEALKADHVIYTSRQARAYSDGMEAVLDWNLFLQLWTDGLCMWALDQKRGTNGNITGLMMGF